MYQLKPLLKHALFTSFTPLLFIPLLYLPQFLLFLQENSTKHTSFQHHDDDSQSQILTSLLSFILEAKSAILGAYSDFLSFSLMMAVVNIVYLIGSKLNGKRPEFFEKSVGFSSSSCLQQSNLEEVVPKNKLLGFSRMMVKLILLYGIIFLTLFSIQPSPKMSYSLSNSVRALEEVQESSIPTITSDIKTLAIGKVLSTLNINPHAMILSKDNKLVYAITKYYGSLKIIDISDNQYPTIIGSLDLINIELFFKCKGIALSSDEKTLFTSTFEHLEIINVTNPTSPLLISDLEIPISQRVSAPSYYTPTFALDGNGKTLYVAGLGLRTFNITDLSQPKLLFEALSPQSWNLFLSATSVALLPNTKNILAYANKTLDFYNVSDPSNPKMIHSYQAKASINSIILSKDIVYAAGLTTDNQIMLEKISIQDFLAPKSICLFDLNNTTSVLTPSIIALSPNETNIFISKTTKKEDYEFNFVDIIGYDLLKSQVMTQSSTLMSNTMTLTFTPSTNSLIVGSNERFGILQLFKNYPNNNIFSPPSNNLSPISLPFRVKQVKSASNIWFVFSNDNTFYSYNMTDTLQKLGSYHFDASQMALTVFPFISLSNNRAYLQLSSDIFALDISDLTKITSFTSPLLSDEIRAIQDFVISHDGNLGFILEQKISKDRFLLSAIDLSAQRPSSLEPFANFTSQSLLPKLMLSKNSDLLFVILDCLYIYNVSTKTPVFISSQRFAPAKSELGALSLTLSQDEKTMFALTVDVGSAHSLQIIDISNLTNFIHIKTLALPKITKELGQKPFILSHDAKKGFLLIDSGILVIDFSNLKSPIILGMIPLVDDTSILNFFLSSDEESAYIFTTNYSIFKINLQMSHTLFLPLDNLLLGNKYSEGLMLLHSTNNFDFLLADPSDYKIVTLSLFDLQIIPSQTSPVTTSTPLPSWITFDSYNQILTIESKRQRDLGSYTLYSMSSKKIPLDAFDEDLLPSLISLGYVDTQRFLTSNFKSYEEFLLPNSSLNNKSKLEIYQILQSYRIETFTGFTITPSLKLSNLALKLSISTPSNYSVKVDIKLSDKAQFLQRNYGTLQPIITEQKSRLTIDGPLESINKALKELVINLDNNFPQSGEITINDNLNPPFSQSLSNISNYLQRNQEPMLNRSHPLTIQQQIDLNAIQTGKFFSINLDPNTFTDNYTENLRFSLLQESLLEIPSWMSFQGLNIRGTPPESLFNREIRLVLRIKNEFKQIETPFVINVSLSWIYIYRLLKKYGPYLAAIIGLIVKANKIYNVLAKKRYRHSKDLYVKTGEVITPNVIFPIRFTAEEKAESEIISKYLKTNAELQRHILDCHMTKDPFVLIDEAKITQGILNIKGTISEKDKQKLKLLFCTKEDQNRVCQYVTNDLTMTQLDFSQHMTTKNIFNRLKEKWSEFIEYDDSQQCFIVNENNLNSQLSNSSDENSSGLLLNKSNMELLKKALVIYVTKEHEVEGVPHAEIDIQFKIEKPKNILWRFLKKDLRPVNYSDKGRTVYGINYYIKDDVLHVVGTPDNRFEGKTLVIQMVNPKQRILKEMWVYGTVASSEEKRENPMNESQERGKEYETL